MAILSNLRSLSITVLTDPVDQRLRVYVESTTELLSMATVIAGLLLVGGLLFLRTSLLAAFQWFRRSVLVSLLVAQPLAFYEQQWTALVGLALNLVLLSALEFGIARESAPVARPWLLRSDVRRMPPSLRASAYGSSRLSRRMSMCSSARPVPTATQESGSSAT